MSRIIEYIVALGDLLMPRACLACGRRLGVRERHLCLSCAADVPYTLFWISPHNPLADRFNAVLERHRGTEPMDYAYATALLYYKGAYRSIPRALKYQGNLAAGRHYGALLGRRLAAAPHLQDIDLVIPVPLHWTRRRSRGYNQAEILARALVDAYRTTPPPVAPAPVPAALAAPAAPAATTSSSGPTERWPVGAGHVEDATTSASSVLQEAPDPSHPETIATVIPSLTRNLPEVRTDLLVRVRRTRTQTRVSVDQKAQNVAYAFQVPERFSLWARLIARFLHLLRNLSARWPIGVGHNEGVPSRRGGSPSSGHEGSHHSRRDGYLPSGRDGSPHSRLDGSHLSEHDAPCHSELDGFRHSGFDGSPPSGHDGSRHFRRDRESPAAVLASAHHILLVDDTFTTGATLYACNAALRPYTTALISIATLAAVEGTPSGAGVTPFAPGGSSTSAPTGGP